MSSDLSSKSGIDPNTLKLTVQKKAKIGSKTDLVRVAAPKAVQILYNIISIGPRVILRSAFQILRANTVTRVLSAVVLVAIDTIGLVRKRISLKQYIINLVLAIMLLVGGTVGWNLGSLVVVAVLLENVILGVIGGLAGAGVFGAAFAMGWDKLVRLFVQDDTADMLDICNRVFSDITYENSLSTEEIAEAKEMIILNAALLSEMYSQKDREGFARNIIGPPVAEIVKRRSI